MPASPTGSPEDPLDSVVRVETDQQLHAVGNLTRHHVLRVLRDEPATITQIAARLGIAKGSSNYHVKVLAKAGLIRVVDTRKVRGVTELYYGMTGTAVMLPDSGAGEPDILMRHALADVEAVPDGTTTEIQLKHLRLSPADYDLAVGKIAALHTELSALHDPRQPAADFFSALYRPQDTKPRDTQDGEPADPEAQNPGPRPSPTPESEGPTS